MSVNSVLLVWWFQSLVKHGLYWTIFWTVTRSGQTWFFALPPLSLQACLDQLRWATWTWPPLRATQPLQLPPAAQRVLYVFLKFSVDLQHKFSTQFLHHRLVQFILIWTPCKVFSTRPNYAWKCMKNETWHCHMPGLSTGDQNILVILQYHPVEGWNCFIREF